MQGNFLTVIYQQSEKLFIHLILVEQWAQKTIFCESENAMEPERHMQGNNDNIGWRSSNKYSSTIKTKLPQNIVLTRILRLPKLNIVRLW